MTPKRAIDDDTSTVMQPSARAWLSLSLQRGLEPSFCTPKVVKKRYLCGMRHIAKHIQEMGQGIQEKRTQVWS